jgi:arylformamidase
MGKCQVIEVDLVPGASITPEDIDIEEINCQRVLFKTSSFPYNGVWHEDFNSLSAELIEKLAQENVVLVGIDTPSIDPATSKKMEAHKAVYESDLRILEGINLEAVIPGKYELLALPLNIDGADASPVRAILIDKGMH